MECPICLDTLNSREIYLSNCNHLFHKKCINKVKVEYRNAIHSIIKCPICRAKNIIEKVEYKTFLIKQIDNVKLRNTILKLKSLETERYFVSGEFAMSLYASLTNKNVSKEYDTINIYKYDPNSRKLPWERNIPKHCMISRINHKTFDSINYNEILLKKTNVLFSDTLIAIRDDSIDCCKLLFELDGEYILFYVLQEYNNESVKICMNNYEKILNNVEKYINRGYKIENYYECECNEDYEYVCDSDSDSDDSDSDDSDSDDSDIDSDSDYSDGDSDGDLETDYEELYYNGTQTVNGIYI